MAARTASRRRENGFTERRLCPPAARHSRPAAAAALTLMFQHPWAWGFDFLSGTGAVARRGNAQLEGTQIRSDAGKLLREIRHRHAGVFGLAFLREQEQREL